MNISYNWLRDLIATSLDARILAERLTMVGLTVDTVHAAGDDFVIEVDLTSNRPDCLSHYGVAREVAVFESGAVVLPEGKPFAREGRTSELTSVEVEDAKLCSRYAARIVRGVRVAPSPAWLANRLTLLGSRPINNVTDITNYVLQELGQPLHAFDFAKLLEHRIVVRQARAGERITTLDDVERELDERMLVIADAARPVAVAGVMGGADSAISDETQDVLIESAHFDAPSVRRTARALGLSTDASYRFERGTDPEGVLRAQERAVSLICELAGGTATDDVIDVYSPKPKAASIPLRFARIAEVLGMKVKAVDAHRILTSLGFAADDADVSSYTAPSWRVDVEREEDLIEEVGRHAGYDHIASELPPSSLAGEYLAGESRRRSARRTLVQAGFNEAINFSFISATHDGMFESLPGQADNSGVVTLSHPIIEDSARMRTSLVPGLLAAVRHNFNHGTRDVRLFETGHVFGFDPDVAKVSELESLAIIATGHAAEAERAGATRELDFFDLKGAIEALTASMKITAPTYAPHDVRHLRRGASAHVFLEGNHLGTVGRLSDELAAQYKFRQPVYVCEFRFDRLLAATETRARYTPLARFPSITRDVTLVVKRGRTLAEMRHAIDLIGTGILRDVRFVDVYEGERVPAGSRSVTLRLEYRTDERTLRDEEVDEAHTHIVRLLEANMEAETRA
jgi:phenylalanyl-tRNA synthetase beta chain